MIGVVGGLGPYAGLDLVRKVFDATPACRDTDHLPVVMLSVPQRVGDRVSFLLGQSVENPGFAIAEVVEQLAGVGATVIGVACNTAHAAPIYDVVRERAPDGCELVHMVEEVAAHVARRDPAIRKVGVLSTTGTMVSNLYPQYLEAVGIETVQLPRDLQERHVQPAIFDPEFGIKAACDPVDPRATEGLKIALDHLVDCGAEAVVLACTEIPMALNKMEGLPLIDATEVLARALCRRSGVDIEG